MAEHIPLANISEEASLSRATSFKWSKKADHHDADFDDDAPPTSPKIQAKRRNSRRMSTASRVSIDFFDPQGVEGLRRSMTREKQTQPSTVPFPAPASSDASSDDSFDMDSKDFDLEKWIRQMIQRCVSSFWCACNDPKCVGDQIARPSLDNSVLSFATSRC
jgi:ATP-binding cassette subfamily G (WHITE) protein 2 (SNQ2)